MTNRWCWTPYDHADGRVPDREPLNFERLPWPPKLSEAELREWFERKLVRL